MNQEIIRPHFGKTIAQVDHDGDSTIKLVFDDGTCIWWTDDGQSCCERRYMTLDGDNPNEFIGATFHGARVKEYTGPIDDEGFDVHDVQWLEIITSKGSLMVSNHNEHNGYYGGFAINVYSA